MCASNLLTDSLNFKKFMYDSVDSGDSMVPACASGNAPGNAGARRPQLTTSAESEPGTQD